MLDDFAQLRGATDKPRATRFENEFTENSNFENRSADETELEAELRSRAIARAAATGTPLCPTEEELFRHSYIIGSTGVGKSTLLLRRILVDIWLDKCVVVIDPHGSLVESVLDLIPSRRIEHTCYLDLSDPEYAVAYNPLANVPKSQAALRALDITDAFKVIFDDWGNRLQHFLFNGIAALMERGDATFHDLKALYYDKTVRDAFTTTLSDTEIREFWQREYYDAYNDRQREEAASPILNRVSQITASKPVRNVLFQREPRLDIRTLIRKNQILLVNLAKGKTRNNPARIVGGLIVADVKSAIFERDPADPSNTTVVLAADEFQNFGDTVYVDMLSELRKYRLQISLAHQFGTQLNPQVFDALLGVTGTQYVFNVAMKDAALLAPQLGRQPEELTNLLKYRAYMNTSSHQIETLPPPVTTTGSRAKVIKASRAKFARRISS